MSLDESMDQRIEKQRDAAKTRRPEVEAVLRKPEWIRIRPSNDRRYLDVRDLLRREGLPTVCQEASCPNQGECYASGTATFLILGDICTRRCPFCDVAHGRPQAPDADEPGRLAHAVSTLGLNYVVITSVDRDDLRDGGGGHFAACVQAVREARASIRVEILTPDFRGRMDAALAALAEGPPDVFNHNMETVPRLYPEARPGADYRHSLELLAEFGRRHPHVPTKSGLMVGLGESDDEIFAVLDDLRQAGVSLLTIGQYLQPSRAHLPVRRYVPPEVFQHYAAEAHRMGFTNAACGPLVRSSYHAEQQARG